MSLQPRSHNEYQPQNPQKANSPYHLSNGAASLLRLVTIADSTASTHPKSAWISDGFLVCPRGHFGYSRKICRFLRVSGTLGTSPRSDAQPSELQSLMSNSSVVVGLNRKLRYSVCTVSH